MVKINYSPSLCSTLLETIIYRGKKSRRISAQSVGAQGVGGHLPPKRRALRRNQERPHGGLCAWIRLRALGQIWSNQEKACSEPKFARAQLSCGCKALRKSFSLAQVGLSSEMKFTLTGNRPSRFATAIGFPTGDARAFRNSGGALPPASRRGGYLSKSGLFSLPLAMARQSRMHGASGSCR